MESLESKIKDFKHLTALEAKARPRTVPAYNEMIDRHLAALDEEMAEQPFTNRKSL